MVERRGRRTAAGLVAVVVLTTGAVVGAAIGAWQLQRPVERGEVARTPTPLPVPAAAPPPVETDEAEMGTQPVWDPFTVVDAPRRRTAVPAELVPPADAPSVLESPIPAAVVAWPQEGRVLRLLGTDGQWRSVPGTESVAPGSLRDVAAPAISRDGTLVAFSSAAGLWVLDVVAGERRVLPWPEEIAAAWDTPPAVRWLAGDDAVRAAYLGGDV